MASELVNSATSDKLIEVDWTKNIEICELVARDHGYARDAIKAIKKRLGSKNANTQLYAVTLLEMLMNNIGDPVHRQVVDAGILPILVKIVKKKSEDPVREKIFLLLDAAQTSVGGASGRFPQYYASYYELVKAGVQFPQRQPDAPRPNSTSNVSRNSPPPNRETTAPPQQEKKAEQAQTKAVSDSSILQKAGTALEVLRDVLNSIDSQGAKEEFTLDLVEQCSFQKQRVMHLAITSRDERTVTRAVEINEKLEEVLRKHDDLVSGRAISSPHHAVHEEEEEEEEQLFRRIRKGKACIRAEDAADPIDRPHGLMGRPIPGEMINRPLIRPLTVDRHQEPARPPNLETRQLPDRHQGPAQSPNVETKHETIGSLALGMNQEGNLGKPGVTIPPPPAKHVEREKFFQENKGDGSALNGNMKNLTLHSRNASSSRSGSTDFSD